MMHILMWRSQAAFDKNQRNLGKTLDFML